MIAYKLLRVRTDGSLGTLFINRTQRLPLGIPLTAESHRTPGYAFRPGWHACAAPRAPHLTMRGRRWYEVRIEGWTEHRRPAQQGGLWYTAKLMTILRPLINC